MATYRKPIMGFGTLPGNDNVWFEPYHTYASNDVWKHMIAVFSDTATRDPMYGRFNVPKNYVGSAKIIVVWTSTATSGDVEWDFDYRAVTGDNSESLDQSGNQESVNQNDTAPGAAHRRMEAALTLTAGNFAADDTVEYTLFRDGTDGGDGIAASVFVHELFFEYADA
jgi:hypothetical protein